MTTTRLPVGSGAAPPDEQLLAETFLPAFRGRGGCDPMRGPVRAWLFGIATNLVRRHARDEERRYRALGRAAAALDPTANDVDSGTASRVDAQALRAELAAALDVRTHLGSATTARPRRHRTTRWRTRAALMAELSARPRRRLNFRIAAAVAAALVIGIGIAVGRFGDTAPLPDGRAFLLQAFSEQQVVEVAEGVHT